MPPSKKPTREIGKRIEYAVDDHARGGDGEGYRHAESARGGKNRISIETEIAVAAAVDGEGAVELGRFFIDRPEMFCAQVRIETVRRQHGADHAQIFDCAAQLRYRGRNILQRD